MKVLPLYKRSDNNTIGLAVPRRIFSKRRPRFTRDGIKGRLLTRPRRKRKPIRRHEPNDNYYENDHRDTVRSDDYNKNDDSSDYPYTNDDTDRPNHSDENTDSNRYHEEVDTPLHDYSDEKSQQSPSEYMDHDKPQLGKHPIHKHVDKPVYSARYSKDRHDEGFQPILHPHASRHHESQESSSVPHYPVAEKVTTNDVPYYSSKERVQNDVPTYYSKERVENDAPHYSREQGSNEAPPLYYKKKGINDTPYYYKTQGNKNEAPYYSKEQGSNDIVSHPKKQESTDDVPVYYLKNHEPNNRPYKPEKQSSYNAPQKTAAPPKNNGYANSPFNFNTFGDFLVPKFA